MKIENVKLSQIKANKSNPRVIKDHKFHKLVKSLLVLPKMLELRPIVVSSDMTILGGNMRFRALQHIAKLPEDERIKILESSNDYNIKKDSDKEKLKAYWNVFCDSPIVPIVKANELSDAEQKEFIIKDNSSFGEWDFDCLANEWDIEDLNDWGVDLPTFDIDEGEEEREIIEDEAPEVDEDAEPITKLGDIWQLGRHRLMCGDSLNGNDICMLLNKVKIDTVFTDPPYDMDFSKEKLHIPIENGHIFVMLDDKNMVEYLRKSEFNFSRFVIADFGFASPRGNDIYCRHILVSHETIGDYCKPINVHDGLADIVKMEYRGRLKDDKTEHKHQKSIKFISDFFLHYGTKKCLDLFGGSGTTLIACEQLNRTCYMMELDPKYCDVIIARWEKLTNQKASKIN